MLTRSANRAGNERRGIILMVVLSMLTLFIILGLAFVLYSDAASTSARIYRESQTQTRAGSDPDRSASDAASAWSMFLGQFIYDLDDNNANAATASNAVQSGLRGHSMARTMYGWNDGANALNDKPYCGTGRLNETINFSGTNLTGQHMPNYTYFPGDSFVRDPGRQGTRTDPTQARAARSWVT